MASKKEEPSQGYQGDAAEATPSPPGKPGPPEHQNSRSGNIVLKSGPLFLSSKGIGWTSWKKRWFILTHTSLVFFRSDPNSVSQKGNEVNLTLGGIDLNNSGSVVVKADKKLITVQFNDGRDGRTFTLKAETLDDLYEWKAALENALSQAPSSPNVTGQNGIFPNDQADADDGSKELVNDKQQPVGSTIIGRPILVALEDVDGAPTFLEKALRYIEEYGVKVEGILRQAADVEDVERRIREYEQGKTDFCSSEDGHVIADCVKYIIRELPSPPVPASCCNALLEACRTQRGSRVNAMRAAVLDTFPEPNRRLLQRILMMMQTVASHKNENLMSTSAVAACMAPLLLRPLLSGECEIAIDFDVGADNSSMQLLQAAAAANHAQTIVITLLEEYDHIFGEASISSDLYTDTDESATGSEEEDDESYDEDESYEDDDATEGSCVSNDDDDDDGDDDDASETGSESGHPVTNDRDVDKDSDSSSSSSESSENDDSKRRKDQQCSKSTSTDIKKSAELSKGINDQTNLEDTLVHQNQSPPNQQSTAVGSGPGRRARRNAVWGRTAAKKNLSMESMDISFEEEIETEMLVAEKSDLQNRLREETDGNTKVEGSMEKRKKALQDRCLSLEKDVARLKEELQRERDKRTALESGLNSSQEPRFLPDKIDKKTKADLKDIAQAEADIVNLKNKVEDLEMQLKRQLEKNSAPCNQRQPNHTKMESLPERDLRFCEVRSHTKRRETDKPPSNPR